MKNLLTLFIVIQLLSCHEIKTPDTFDNLKKGIDAAQERKVKIFLVFDAFGSPTNYVDSILEDEKIATALKHAIIVRLKCDDKNILSEGSILSVGEINSKLQREITSEYYQPMFCFLDEKGTRISPILGYSKKENVIEYIKKYIN